MHARALVLIDQIVYWLLNRDTDAPSEEVCNGPTEPICILTQKETQANGSGLRRVRRPFQVTRERRSFGLCLMVRSRPGDGCARCCRWMLKGSESVLWLEPWRWMRAAPPPSFPLICLPSFRERG